MVHQANNDVARLPAEFRRSARLSGRGPVGQSVLHKAGKMPAQVWKRKPSATRCCWSPGCWTIKCSGLAPVRVVKGPDGQFLEGKTTPNRRSLYLAQARTRSMTFLHDFDAPDMTSDNLAQRFRSALPVQSLALLNSPLVMRATDAFARQLLKANEGNLAGAVRQAFETAYARPPTPEEMKIANQSVAVGNGSRSRRAWACFCMRSWARTISFTAFRAGAAPHGSFAVGLQQRKPRSCSAGSPTNTFRGAENLRLGCQNERFDWNWNIMRKLLSRREALQEVALGFGGLALGALMANEASLR